MLYLIRHGLDDENYIGGWSKGGLTSEGIEQVKQAIPFIKTLPIKRIISSDVDRAIQTTEIINDELHLPVHYDQRYRELDKGKITGLPIKLADTIFPERHHMGVYDKYPEGESMMDLYKRIINLLHELQELDDTLIVTHRGIINMLYFLLNDMDVDMDKKQFNVTHASIHEANIKEKVIRRIY